MKMAGFVSTFAIFTLAIFLMVPAAQSNSVAHANHATALSQAEGPNAEAAFPAFAASQKPPVHFANAVTYSSGGFYASSVAIADLNGDGKLDLVVVNACETGGNCSNGGDVSVLVGNGDGTFQAPVSYSSGGVAAAWVAIGDVNGDGHPDLIVANECESSGNCDVGVVSVLLGNGNGTFQAPVSNAAGYGADSVAIGDVNGDGYPDLVVANQYQCNNCSMGGVSVLLGNGDGTFQSPVSSSSGGIAATSVAIGDVNGDGHLDLVVANEFQCASCGNGGVGVLLGNGDGTFQAPVSRSSGGYGALSVAIGDVNGDGNSDLIVTNLCDHSYSCRHGLVGVLLGNGDGTFQARVTYNSGGYGAASVLIRDVNGDGKPDLVVANLCRRSSCNNGALSVLLGNGDGTFQNAVSFSSGGKHTYSAAIGDVNGDGRPDLVPANLCASASSCSGSVAVLLNNSTAKTTTTVMSSPNPSHVNQSVTFTATVTSTPPVPDGEILTFYHGKTNLGTGATTSGVASLTTSFPKANTYSIKASYPGDAFHKASAGTVKQVVSP